MTPYALPLVALGVASAALLAYVSARVAAVALRVGGDELYMALASLLFLTLGQLLGGLSAAASDARLAAALYVASAVSTLSSFLTMALSQRLQGALVTTLFPALLVAPDFAASAAAALASIRSAGIVKRSLQLFAVAFLLRGLSLAIAQEGVGLLLLASEALKAASATALASHHFVQVLRR